MGGMRNKNVSSGMFEEKRLFRGPVFTRVDKYSNQSISVVGLIYLRIRYSIGNLLRRTLFFSFHRRCGVYWLFE
jgi:hypothetical protein